MSVTQIIIDNLRAMGAAPIVTRDAAGDTVIKVNAPRADGTKK